jgi:hypothetical protein
MASNFWFIWWIVNHHSARAYCANEACVLQECFDENNSH